MSGGCLCWRPPDPQPALLPLADVTAENVNEQIKVRRHMIQCVLVGTLWPGVLRDEIVDLFEKFPHARTT